MRLLLLCVFALVLSHLRAQNMRFSHLDQKQGLSQNTATAFVRDRDGFVWVGTQDGLNQYDGYSFKVYRKIAGDTNTIPDNFILTLTEDTDGNIWIGTRNGLCVHSKRSGKFYRYYQTAEERSHFHSSVRLLSALRDSGIIYRTVTSSATTLVFTLDKNLTPQFKVMTTFPDARIFSYCGTTDQLAYLKGSEIVFCNSTGQFSGPTYSWKPTSKSGSTMLLTETGLYINDSLDVHFYSSFMNEGSGIVYQSDARISTLALDSTQQLWIGTTDGLRVIDPRPHCLPCEIVAKENSSDFFSLTGKQVESIYVSPEKLVWIGTVGAINIYDPRQTLFVHPVANGSNFAREEAIWFVMSVGQITLFANDNAFGYESSTGLVPSWVKAIPNDLHFTAGYFDSADRLWLGTKNDGILIIDTVTLKLEKKYFRSPMFTGYPIMDICEGSDGKIWIAAIGWLGTIDVSTLESEMITCRRNARRNIQGAYFTALEPDGKGNIFVSSAAGLYRFHERDTLYEHYVNDPADTASLGYNIINDIELSGSDLWIATMGSGLDHMNLQTSTFTHYTTNDGLANNTVYGIEKDSKGNLWLSTNEGLVNFNPVTKASRNYTMRDGLPTNEFVINKHAQNSTDGKIYFGSSRGVVGFNPNDFTQSLPTIKPAISQLLINFKERPFPSDSILVLLPDERNITFTFTAIDYRNQDKITYEYRLVGFDSTWRSAPGGNRMAVYTNLPYGQYSFEVRYRISGEPWSPVVLQKYILIETPFYATTWFRILMVISGVMLIALIVRYISQRKLRKQLEEMRVQEQIRNEKERISRDLHDNVGAQLTYVISSLDNLSYTLQRKKIDGESEKLEQLGEFARGTMDQLRESIWAINSEQIKLSELAARWKQYLSQLADTRGDFTGQLSFEGSDLLLKPSVAIEVHRIVQEAITNAFRHSKGNKILIEVDIENNRPSVSIVDNGQGMGGNPEKEGHYGLRNMKDRAKNINGDLSFTSDSNGTTVHLHWTHN